MARVRDSTHATTKPVNASRPRPANSASAVGAMPSSNSAKPRSVSTTIKPHDASASGPTVPRMIRPM